MRGNVILVLGSILVAGTVTVAGLSYLVPMAANAGSSKPAEPERVPKAADKSFLLPETQGPTTPATPESRSERVAVGLDAVNRQLNQIEAVRQPGAVSFKPGEPMIDPQPR